LGRTGARGAHGPDRRRQLTELQLRYNRACREIEAANESLGELVADIELPAPPTPPAPDMTGKDERREPLIDSDWEFIKGTLALIADRGYEGADDVGEETE
jgi:hypothetical protein